MESPKMTFLGHTKAFQTFQHTYKNNETRSKFLDVIQNKLP